MVATLLAFLVGTLAGVVTGLLHTKGKIDGLLAGILTMIALYSINLRIMGKANVSAAGREHRDVPAARKPAAWAPGPRLALMFVGCLVVVALIVWFLRTDVGLAMRATGDNEEMIRSFGVSTDNQKILGLALSNGLVGFSGAVIAQFQGFADIGMGIGVILIGLASVIVGQAIFGQRFIWIAALAVVFGSVVYRLVIQLALNAGLEVNDMKLISAVLVVVALILPQWKGFSKFANRIRIRGKATTDTEVKERWEPMLEISNLSKTFFPGTVNERKALRNINLNLTDGRIRHGDRLQRRRQVDRAEHGRRQAAPGHRDRAASTARKSPSLPDHARAKYIGRVFQDPMAGTAPNMTIEENMSTGPGPRQVPRAGPRASPSASASSSSRSCAPWNSGWRTGSRPRSGLLSGGQRQALSLLMATFSGPEDPAAR